MTKFVFNASTMIIFFAIAAKKKIKLDFDGKNVIRMDLSDAKPHALDIVEDIFIELFKTVLPELWEKIKLFRSYKRICDESDYVFVSTEFSIIEDQVNEVELQNARMVIQCYMLLIYLMEQKDLFNGIENKLRTLPDSIQKTMISLAIDRRRKIGGKSTKWNHALIVGGETYNMKHFLPKPDFTNGLPDRKLQGEIVGFHSHGGKSYIELLYKNNDGNKNIIEKFFYVKDEFDKLIRVAIDEESRIEVIVREKIDDKLNLYWGVVELSLL